MIDAIEDKIIAFFEGELSAEEERILMEKRQTSPEIESIFQDYVRLYNDMDQQPLAQASTALRAGFEQLLKAEQAQQPQEARRLSLQAHPQRRWMPYAAAIAALFVAGLAIGFYLSNRQVMNGLNEELALLRSNMNELLRNESTSMRIKAVNLSYSLSKPDPEVVEALIRAMNSDASENVRLAAIDALGSFANDETVKDALIQALSEHKNAFIQIKLINILQNIKAKEALPSLDQLIEDEQTQQFVRSKARKGKEKIINI